MSSAGTARSGALLKPGVPGTIFVYVEGAAPFAIQATPELVENEVRTCADIALRAYSESFDHQNPFFLTLSRVTRLKGQCLLLGFCKQSVVGRGDDRDLAAANLTNVWAEPPETLSNTIPAPPLEPACGDRICNGPVYKGLTLNRLVILCTDPARTHAFLRNATLLTARVITTPATLFTKLLQRYALPVPPTSATQAAALVLKTHREIQIRVVDLLKRWLTIYPEDFSPRLLSRVTCFAAEDVAGGGLHAAARDLINLTQRAAKLRSDETAELTAAQLECTTIDKTLVFGGAPTTVPGAHISGPRPMISTSRDAQTTGVTLEPPVLTLLEDTEMPPTIGKRAVSAAEAARDCVRARSQGGLVIAGVVVASTAADRVSHLKALAMQTPAVAGAGAGVGEEEDVPKTLAYASPSVIAAHIACFLHEAYLRIRPRELLGQLQTKDHLHHLCPNLCMTIDCFNRVSAWASLAVLEAPAKERVRVVGNLIAAATELHKLQHYEGLFALMSALRSSPIRRLTPILDLKSTQTRVLREFDRLTTVSSNNNTYRAAARTMTVNSPGMPYTGVLLRDLTYVEDGNPVHIGDGHVRDGEAPPRINYFRSSMHYSLVYEYLRHQAGPKYETQARLVQNMYWDELVNVRMLSSDEIYELSYKIHPRAL